MEVSFSGKTKEDFRKYNDFIRRKKKSDGHKYQKYELDKIQKSFKGNIVKGLEGTKFHRDSIFPKEFEYNSKDFKMYVDKKSHHIVFYSVVSKGGDSRIIVDKCIHSKELKKELDKKGIKPLEDSDPQLLLDYITIEREDKVNDETLTDEERDEYNKKEKELESRIESQNKKEGKKKEKEKPEDKGKEEEVYDKETGKKVKKIVHTGPKGGRFYKSDNGEKVYIDEKRTFKSLSSLLLESKMISLNQYIKNRKVL